ncbi:hypothetical protein CL629_01765 [bacterium]|nr:hypothetical protein [bacterium]|tara:strand:- start:693 stop:1559 length:867 start_codon:yes stop_codon:yes gene_type:complete
MNFENKTKNSKERFSVEQICEQGAGLMNEDVFFAQGNVFGVADGASSSNDWEDPDGKTGGYRASHIVEHVVRTSEDLSPREQLLKANKRVDEEMREHDDIDIQDKCSVWTTTAALVRVEDESFLWAQIGDSRIVLIYKDETFKTLGSDLDWDIEIIALWQKLVQKGVFEERARDNSVIDKQVKKVRSRANADYGLLNGDERMEEFLQSGEKPLENVSAILLFTDGLTIPKEDPRLEDDIAGIVRLYNEGGLSGVKDRIRSLEKSDPKFQRFPRLKPSDDIAAVAIKFS